MSDDIGPAPDEYWVWYQRRDSTTHWYHAVAEDLVGAYRIADVLTSEGARNVQVKGHSHAG
ncbi:hypothetical protein SEA_HEXBUG_57 [Gordonia phage Hexbug]|nr:hypothetical protein SEA_ORLA_57 [Gordonia phage Orla]UVK62971.1 hypothetical protein SEA_HEXBUG_57 [Gordonia phage Hexbug]WNN96148.1 hypothetical protein SEA_NODIGI_57 [Gordonia phage Nodigi]